MPCALCLCVGLSASYLLFVLMNVVVEESCQVD